MTRSIGPSSQVACAMLKLALATVVLLSSTGCIAANMLRKQVAIEEHPYAFKGMSLSYFEGTITDEKGIADKARPQAYSTEPVVLFIEGDGSDCQSYTQPVWYRFLFSYTGHYVLVRPKGYINATCGTDKWKTSDFQARVDEIEAIMTALKQGHPDQPIVLVGHSAGAHIAAIYAQAHPGDVAAIVNMAGGVDDLERVMKQSQREKGLGMKDLSENERDIDAVIEHLKSPAPDKPLWGRTEKFWAQMLSMQQRDVWLKTTVPVLILHAEGDTTVPYTLMPKAKRELNRAGKDNYTWTFISGEGHDLIESDVFLIIDQWIRKKLGKRGAKDDD